MKPFLPGSNRLEIALAVARHGARVFPVSRNGTPCFKNFPELASADESEIRAWAKQYPNANYSMITGETFDVLDVDNHGEIDGRETLGKITEGQDAGTLTVRSKSGGLHLWFRANGEKLKTGPLGADFPGLEIKGERGWITLPGSLAEGGASYDFIENREPSAVPDWLSRIVRSAQKTEKPATTSTCVTRITEGGRNADAFKLARRLHHSGASTAGIYAALVVENANRYDPPLPESELKTIAESAGKTLPGEECVNIVPVTMESERRADIPARTWFLDGIVTPGFILLISKKGIGKSFFILQAMIAMAGGAPFLGRGTLAVKILYVPLELDRIAIHERTRALDPIPENLHVVYEFPSGDKALEAAEKLFQDGYRIIVFDMFVPLIPDYEFNAYETSSIFLRWRRLALKYQAAVIALWHSGKAERQDFMDTAIGTTGLLGQSDSVIMLDRKRGNPNGKIFVGGNHGRESVLPVAFENCRWELTEGESADFVSQNDQRLIDLVKKYGFPAGVDPMTISVKAPMGYEAARKALSRLAARDLIQKLSRGKYAPKFE